MKKGKAVVGNTTPVSAALATVVGAKEERIDRMEHEAVGMMRIEMDTLSVLTVNKAYEKLWTKCNLLTRSLTHSLSH